MRYNKLGYKSLTSTRFELIAPKPNLLLVKRAAGETVQLIAGHLFSFSCFLFVAMHNFNEHVGKKAFKMEENKPQDSCASAISM